MTLQIRARGLEHAQTRQTIEKYADALYNEQMYDEALPLHEQFVASRKAVSGIEDIDCIQSMHNLATAYRELSRTEEALTMAKEALELSISALGLKNTTTPNIMNTISLCYDELDQHLESY